MLKSISNIKNVQELSKEKQRNTLGGMQYLCEDTCTFGFRRCYTSKTDYFYQPC